MEVDPQHARVASANIARSGLTDVVDLRLGAALDTLPQLAVENRGPFDLTFIDADKVHTPDYFEWALRLSRPGSLIIVDNVVRKGAVVDAESADPNVQGVRRFFDLASRDPRVSVTAIQTVGAKGYDGMAIARVLAPQS
jgi:predicted O-methyltransferase YrrM